MSVKKNEAEFFYEAIKSNKLSSYRNFRNSIIDKNFAKIDNKFNANLSILQRSAEFFQIRANIINFIYLKKKHKYFFFPFQWCKELNLDYATSIISHILFSFYIFKLSLTRIIRSIYTIINIDHSYDLNTPDSVFLFSVSGNEINQKETHRKYNLVGWLDNNIFKKKKKYFHSYKGLTDSKNQIYLKSYLPTISILKKIKIFLFFIPFFLLCLMKLFIGKWHDLYMADDTLIKNCFINSNPKYFMKHYIIPYVGTQFCPSWTNVVIKSGSKVHMLNYSSSSEPYLNGQSKDDMLYRISSWQNIIPFNKQFALDLKKTIMFPSNIFKGPTVFYSHNGYKMEKYVKKDFISIFDIPPLNPKKYIGFSSNYDYIFYYHEANIMFFKKFFDDIVELSKKLDLQIVLKQKRNDPRLELGYNNMLTELVQKEDLIILPPNISPYYVVDCSLASIVQPFTSVGYYNDKSQNIAFYDPLEILSPHNQEIKNSKLIIGKSNLDIWLNKIKKIDK